MKALVRDDELELGRLGHDRRVGVESGDDLLAVVSAGITDDEDFVCAPGQVLRAS